ncbi:uncharacterized protein [Arachis hypogaea]|uniref:uncharacterized protein n=1 Tax=Arachis hypogaea TaxID=3818 RepID=UPI003B2169F0
MDVNSKGVPSRHPDNPFPVTLDTHPALPKAPKYKVKLSYPQKLQKAEKNKQFAKFLEVFKKLEIISIAKALEQMPSYAKFMKDILSNKRDWREEEIVILTKEYSAIIQRNLPEKMQDPGSFWKTCLCEWDPFSFPIDFVILEMEEDKNASIILGRPFLATERTIIEVQKGEVTLIVNKDEIVLNAIEAMKHTDHPEECMKIDAIESLVEEVFEAEKLAEELDTILEDILPELDERATQRETLSTPSVGEGPPKLELKPLPPSLKYAFIGDKTLIQ